MDNKPEIKVFFTKTYRIRAKIKDKGMRYEVTVNGKSWQEGVGSEYKEIVLRKATLMMARMKKELHIALTNEF